MSEGRIFWSGRCDENHAWTVVQDAGEVEPAGEPACPEGHPAVTWSAHTAVERFAVTAEPAARVADRVTGVVHLDRDYFIRVTNVVTGMSRQTSRTFTRAEVGAKRWR